MKRWTRREELDHWFSFSERTRMLFRRHPKRIALKAWRKVRTKKMVYRHDPVLKRFKVIP